MSNSKTTKKVHKAAKALLIKAFVIPQIPFGALMTLLYRIGAQGHALDVERHGSDLVLGEWNQLEMILGLVTATLLVGVISLIVAFLYVAITRQYDVVEVPAQEPVED